MKTLHIGKRSLKMLVLVGLALASIPAWSQARDVDAAPQKEYAIVPEAGPWLICAAAYTGPQAPRMAHDLVLEIRQRYKLPAYVFDRGAKERRDQEDRLEKLFKPSADTAWQDPHVQSRLRSIMRVEEQCAVLLGGYKDMETARRALDDVKKLQPPEKVPTDIITYDGPDPNAQGSDKRVVKQARLNPFAQSFVVHNPTVPLQKEEDKPNRLLKELNDGRPYNLLKCRHPWTLAVAEYQGASVIQTRSESNSFLGALKLGSDSGKLLNASALQAESVAEALHKLSVQNNLGFETYVLHTRHSSVVCVGGFDSPDDPKLRQTQRVVAKTLLGSGCPIKLFATPLPMAVPRL